MKLIVYTLDADGTIPNYIVDGGYLPWANGGISPQDYDLVGVSTDTAAQEGFADDSALLVYAEEKEFIFTDPTTKEVVSSEIVINKIWSKINE